jgi:hypothetical protein
MPAKRTATHSTATRPGKAKAKAMDDAWLDQPCTTDMMEEVKRTYISYAILGDQKPATAASHPVSLRHLYYST